MLINLLLVLRYLLALLLVSGRAHAVKNVIIDTDIGSDFDDTVAIGEALQNPNLNVLLILTASGNTTARAMVVAKFLTMVNRTDIPIGVGVATTLPDGALFSWAQDFDLSSYPGTYYLDGVGAAIDAISSSAQQGQSVDIIAIAPATNFPSLLQRAPDVTQFANIKAMSGSVYRGYNNASTPCPEYNVYTCPSCSWLMYSAGWNVTITPLDTCGTAQLSGSNYLQYLRGQTRISQILAQAQFYWTVNGGGDYNIYKNSDIWYDSVATFLVDDPVYLEFTTIRLEITSDGSTIISPNGALVSAALNWGNYNQEEENYETYLATMLTTPLQTQQ